MGWRFSSSKEMERAVQGLESKDEIQESKKHKMSQLSTLAGVGLGDRESDMLMRGRERLEI